MRIANAEGFAALGEYADITEAEAALVNFYLYKSKEIAADAYSM